jgi:hypothetical protein
MKTILSTYEELENHRRVLGAILKPGLGSDLETEGGDLGDDSTSSPAGVRR